MTEEPATSLLQPAASRSALRLGDRAASVAAQARALADQAFSRAAGAPLVQHNGVRLLRNAAENYPAWLAAIRGARHYVHFENYIFRDDATGEMFAKALIETARGGVCVRVIYDWVGAFGKTSRAFWSRMRAGGVDVRCHNPPRLESPLGWLSRDHRKVLAVDGELGYVSGLCIGNMWAGDPGRNIEPWRDTGVEIRGPAVADIERAFAQVWSMLGPPLPAKEMLPPEALAPAGEISVRIVASEPATFGTFRLDQLVVAFARKRVWLADAYYVGTPTYMQALITAARDEVDVRILLPSATDMPIVRPLTRSGYRPLLEAGVRIFEWNGSMMHAKTAVVDGRWARVGSTNLNVTSWLGNFEMDAVIEDESFASQMEAMYLDDLANATEVVLNEKRKVRAPGQPRLPLRHRGGRGGASRAAAGAVRIGNVLSAAITNRRTIEPQETRLMVSLGIGLLALAVLIGFYPGVLAYPALLFLAWLGIALVYRGWKAPRKRP